MFVCTRRAILTLFAIIALLLSVRNKAEAQNPKVTAQPKVYEVHLWVGRDVAPGPSIRLSINTRNLPTLQLSAYKIDAIPWLLHRGESNDDNEAKNPKDRPQPLPPGKPVRTWALNVWDKDHPASGGEIDKYFSRQINLPSLPPGVYLLVASAGGKEDWGVVNITNLAIVMKRAPQHVLTWVTDNATGDPVSGARVRLWNRGKKGERMVAEGTTKPDGTCLFATPPNPEQTLIVERNSGSLPDMAGLRLGNESPDGKLTAHVQTDRPVYRPGGQVQFRAILRRTQGRIYAPVSGESVDVEVRDGKDNVLQRTRETSTALGTVAASFDIPPSGILGAYTIVLTTKDKQTAYTTFGVAEYRKPEFQVAVKPGGTRYLAGQDASFSVQADYYFGAPLPQAQVQYQIRRSPNPFYGFSEDDNDAQWFASGDGNLYARDTYNAEPFVAEGTVTTDKTGHVEIPFKTKGDLPDSVYSITCTVIDGQRRQVQASSGVPVYAASLRVGLRTRVLAAPLGSLVPVDLRLTDLDGKPAKGKVTLTAQADVYDPNKHIMVTKQFSSQMVTVPASGKATAKVPALIQGEMTVTATVKDATGRLAHSAIGLWVIDPFTRMETESTEPSVTIKLGRESYQPGNTVQAFLTTTTPTRPTLLTVQGGDIFAYIVVPKGKPSFAWSFPATLAMSPNAYIGAAQWAKPSKLVSGSVVLPVPDRTRLMTLTITSDHRAYQPGDRATYTIRARNSKTGQPVPNAEVALGVVDESIYAVRPDATPDPYEIFWGLRQDLTDMRTSAPEELSGGAYQRNSTNGVAPVRERFLDTAFWSAHLLTGPDGTATATVDLPGNLTSWRATAVGVTNDTQVGHAAQNITVSRPVMLRLATPRQFVQGDHLTLIGTITNRTDTARDFEASLTLDGVALAPGESGTKTAHIDAKGEGKVTWSVAAPNLPPGPDFAAHLEGILITKNLAPGEASVDYSDHLRLRVPVLPLGVASHVRAGAALPTEAKTAPLTISLPKDRIDPATALTVQIEGGVGQAAIAQATERIQSEGWNSVTAADLLLVASAPGSPKVKPKRLRDTLALISRDQVQTGGWGWWQGSPSDAGITARVLSALLAAKKGVQLPPGVPFPDALLARGLAGARAEYNGTNLWEERAELAVALTAADPKNAALLEEVQNRGHDYLSPYTTLLLAHGLSSAGKGEAADHLIDRALKVAVIGPDAAYVPAGDHPGWHASTVATTAQALNTLMDRNRDSDLQAKLARWLAHPSDGEDTIYLSSGDGADSARALLRYVQQHGISRAPLGDGDVSLTVNGTVVPFAKRAPGTEDSAPLMATVPQNLITDENTVTVQRTGGSGELFVTADATVYRPQTNETDEGMRVLRRWEVQNAFGLWEPLRAGEPIRPSAPVRVTVVVWPNEEADALKIVEPLPSGFEFVDSELQDWAREEVRDSAIIHFLTVSGSTPVTFRYYLRAESDGEFSALPATGELIRRPAIRGTSAPETVTVHEATGTEEGKP